MQEWLSEWQAKEAKVTRYALLLLLVLLLVNTIISTYNYVEDKESQKMLQGGQEELQDEISSLKKDIKDVSEQNKAIREAKERQAEQHNKELLELLEKLDNILLIDDFQITAYTKECGYPWDDGITYTGAVALPFYTMAVDPNLIPLGSRITILDSGGNVVTKGVAQDIGAAVKGNVIDLYFGEGPGARERALSWGRRNKRIIVYKS